MYMQVPEGALEQELSRIPMWRAGEPAEVASLVSFLCMPSASTAAGPSMPDPWPPAAGQRRFYQCGANCFLAGV